jgi:hypothetical protein
MKKTILSLLIAVELLGSASADTFGTGANQFTLDFLEIGNAGEGGVSYAYKMGKYEVSQNQVDAAIANGLQNVYTWAGPSWSGDKPATLSWFGSAAFVNWLNTSTGHESAYNISWDGSSWSLGTWNGVQGLIRNPNAYYFLPSEEEFYKASYYSPETQSYNVFPTGNVSPTPVTSGTLPNSAVYTSWWSFDGNSWEYITPSSPANVYQAGGLSSYGSMGQGGNVAEWYDNFYIADQTSNITQTIGITPLGGVYNSSIYIRNFNVNYLDYTAMDIGFRVGAVPEPSTYALFGIGALALVITYRRKVA